MGVNIYLYFNGNCREALEFYEQVFGTKQYQTMTYGETPPNPDFILPEEVKHLIMHARLNINGSVVMFSDTFPGSPFIVGNNVTLSLISTNEDILKTYYNKLKEGGIIGQELTETFWSKAYGSLTDKFGIEWQVSHINNEAEM